MKKERSIENDAKSGFALIFIMLAIGIIGILGLTALARGQQLAVAAIRLTQESQLQWRCDAALEEATLRLWSENTANFTSQSLATVDISGSGAPDTYLVKATATNPSGKSLTIQQTIEIHFKHNYDPENTAMINGGDGADPSLQTGNNGDITGEGSISVIGDVSFGKHWDPESVPAQIYISGTANLVADNVHTGYVVEVDDIVYALREQMDNFQAEITAGGAHDVYDGGTLNLNNQTIVLSALGGSFSGINTITGTGTIIIPGDLTLENNSTVTITDNVTILVDGHFEALNNSGFTGNGNAIYVKGNAVFNQNSLLEGAVLVGGNLNVSQNAEINGLLYGEGDNFHFYENAIINGFIIANTIKIKNNAELNLSEVGLPRFIQEMMADWLGSREIERVSRRDWKKI